jgi:hypothetical protein
MRSFLADLVKEVSSKVTKASIKPVVQRDTRAELTKQGKKPHAIKAKTNRSRTPNTE